MPSILEKTNAIQDYLDGMSLLDIGKKYGVSRPAVKNFLVKHNIELRDRTYKKRSKYEFNEHWLDEIDCQEKAYFLGFFAADGNLDDSNNDYCLRFKISTHDKYILEKFNKLFNSNREIVDRIYRNPHNKTGKEYCSEFKLGSKYLFNRMIELGFPPRKSLILDFPEYMINSELLSHFIRGYYDGDGSISIMQDDRKTKRATITIAGSNSFIPKLQNILKNININSFVKKGHTDNYCLLDIDRQEDIKPFLDLIYKNSKIHLKRKYDRYIEFLEGRDFTKDEGANRRRIKELEPLIAKDIENKELKVYEIQKKYDISSPTYYKILNKYKK